MGHTFYGANGTYIGRNIDTGNYLAKITLGLWKKIGCYPKTEEDCKLVARILRNRIHLNQYHREYYEEIYDWEKESEESIQYLKKLASFFEECGGIIDVNKFTLKYGDGEYYEKKRKNKE